MNCMDASFTDLMKAVPDDHKKFLADLLWVHEEVRSISRLYCFFGSHLQEILNVMKVTYWFTNMPT